MFHYLASYLLFLILFSRLFVSLLSYIWGLVHVCGHDWNHGAGMRRGHTAGRGERDFWVLRERKKHCKRGREKNKLHHYDSLVSTFFSVKNDR